MGKMDINKATLDARMKEVEMATANALSYRGKPEYIANLTLAVKYETELRWKINEKLESSKRDLEKLMEFKKRLLSIHKELNEALGKPANFKTGGAAVKRLSVKEAKAKTAAAKNTMAKLCR